MYSDLVNLFQKIFISLIMKYFKIENYATKILSVTEA